MSSLEEILTPPQPGADTVDTPEKADNLESIAREMGWKPETEWKGDPPEGGFATAADYIRSQRAHAKNLEKDIKKLRTETERRIERMEKQSAKQREKEIEALHSEYDYWIKKAVKDGDEEQFDKLTREKADAVKKAEKAAEEDKGELSEEEWIEGFKPAFPQLQTRFYEDGHAWILEDEADPDALRLVVDLIDSGIPFPDALEKADRALRKAYPDQYEEDDMDEDDEPQPKRNGKRVPVLAPGGRGNGGHVSLASQMTKAQREIGARFVRDELFANLEEYGEVLKKNGRLGKSQDEP